MLLCSKISMDQFSVSLLHLSQARGVSQSGPVGVVLPVQKETLACNPPS